MKIAIVDDDITFLKTITDFISMKFNENNVPFYIDSFTDGFELIKKLNQDKYYDFIFLDYEMPTINGYELGKMIRKNNESSKLIYVTNCEEKVYECIENEIFRFILKKNFDQEMTKCLQVIVKNYIEENKAYTFNSEVGKIQIFPTEIYFFEYIGRNIYVKTVKYKKSIRLTSTSLKNIYSTFTKYGFIYSCRGIIVNLYYVDTISYETVIMKDGTALSLSRRRKRSFKDAYINYIKNF